MCLYSPGKIIEMSKKKKNKKRKVGERIIEDEFSVLSICGKVVGMSGCGHAYIIRSSIERRKCAAVCVLPM